LNFYKISEFSEKINKAQSTLRLWDKKGILKPHHITAGGHRMYSDGQLYEVLNIPRQEKHKRKVIGYTRVSTSKQKDDLNRQIENVKTYMIAKGYSFDIITDIGSGVNYKNKGLNKLIRMIVNNKVEKIVVLYKDRLVRFGFELIEAICKEYDVEIEVIDNSIKTDEQELVEDMIQIVTVFSCRLQGKRANKAKKLLKEVKALEINEDKN